MGDMADDLTMQEFNLTHLPETHRRNGFGKYTYVENDTKHYFQTLEDANRWAKSKGFKLSTTPPKDLEKTDV